MGGRSGSTAGASRTSHDPAFKPIVDVRARIYDLAHEAATQDACPTWSRSAASAARSAPAPPRQGGLDRKRRAVDTVLDDVGGVVTRVGDETVGEMWSLFDGQDVLAEIDPRFSENIRAHVERAALARPLPRVREHRP